MVFLMSLGFSAGPPPPIPPMNPPPPAPPARAAPPPGVCAAALCVAHAISSSESCEATISR